MSNHKHDIVAISCDCGGCCMFVVEKRKWDDGDIDYGISVQHSRYDYHYNTAWGRIKRTCAILAGRTIYYNSAIINGDEAFGALVNDMRNLIENNVKTSGEHRLITDETMGRKRIYFTYPCDLEKVCMFVFEKERERNTVTSETWVEYLVSVQDYRNEKSESIAWDRIKRAFRSLFGKPVSFNDSYMDSEEKFMDLVENAAALLDSDI